MNEEKQTTAFSPTELAEKIAELLDSKKGKNIVTIDISGKTIIADYFVIASAYSVTAVKALGDYVEDELSKLGLEPLHRDIDPRWAVLDYGSVIVHVFHKELRDFYSIERLWADGAEIVPYVGKGE